MMCIKPVTFTVKRHSQYSQGLSQTIMDQNAPMYKFAFFDPESESTRKERKALSDSVFGKSTKRGQLVPNY